MNQFNKRLSGVERSVDGLWEKVNSLGPIDTTTAGDLRGMVEVLAAKVAEIATAVDSLEVAAANIQVADDHVRVHPNGYEYLEIKGADGKTYYITGNGGKIAVASTD